MQRRVRQHRAEVALADGDLRVHRVAALRAARLRAGLAARARPSRHSSSTIGCSGDVSSAASSEPTRQCARSSSRPANMTASGLSGRRLRSFRRRTASPSVASQARWKPPRPLTARISPARSSSAAARMGAAGSASPPAASSLTPSPLRAQPQQPHARTAHRARVGLRVEAAVARVLVLPPAGRTQREAPHRRPLAVVGQVLDDGEPRAAVGAVGERVVVAPVGRVEQLAPAVVAGGDVRRDELVGAGVGVALEDDERVAGRRAVDGGARLHLPHLAGGDVAARRRLRRQRLGEAPSRRAGAPSASTSTPAEVLRTQPRSPHRGGERVDEGAKADALDDAAHADAHGVGCDPRGVALRAGVGLTRPSAPAETVAPGPQRWTAEPLSSDSRVPRRPLRAQSGQRNW